MSNAENASPTRIEQMSTTAINERISLLGDEIQANEEENRMMEAEIKKLEDELEKRGEL